MKQVFLASACVLAMIVCGCHVYTHQQDAEHNPAPAAPTSTVANGQLEVERRLDEYIANEPVDPVWSAESADGARNAFVHVVGSRIQSAECRTKVCRFVITSESKDAQNAIAGQIIGVGPFADNVWYAYESGTTPPRATLYVSRHGVPLMSVLAARK